MEAEWTHGPVVAGMFYPGDGNDLRNAVSDLLREAQLSSLPGRLRALIAPHAAYVYSGPVAATAYVLLDADDFDDVLLIGPSHFERFAGLAALDAARWRTPLGDVPVRRPQAVPIVTVDRVPYRREHSLEVQLPFLQVALGEVPVTPLLTGSVEVDAVTAVLDEVIAETTLLVVSTDLSHYRPYETANRLDRATADAVVSREVDELAWGSACGLTGMQAAVGLARRRGWTIQLLDLRNSGDTAGARDQVVGYAAFALAEP